MEARRFKQANLILAEKQEEYEDLPVEVIQSSEVPIVMSFKLSEKEIKQVVETGTIYLTVLTFGHQVQPIGMSCLNPYIKEEL